MRDILKAQLLRGVVNQVLLIEGHRLMRYALRELLAENGFKSIAEATNPVEAVRQAIDLMPDIIVLDSTWTEIQGSCLSRILRVLTPKSRIVLLVDQDLTDEQEFAHWSGVDALVRKSALTQGLPQLLARWQPGEQTPPSPQGV